MLVRSISRFCSKVPSRQWQLNAWVLQVGFDKCFASLPVQGPDIWRAFSGADCVTEEGQSAAAELRWPIPSARLASMIADRLPVGN